MNLERDIGAILAKLESLEKLLEKHVVDDKEMANRVYSLEKKQWYMAGALGLLVFLGDVVLKGLGLKV